MSDIVDLRVAAADQMGLRGDIIVVTVEEGRFHVHRDLITAHSGRFEAIFDDEDLTDPERHIVTLEH
ncbi:Putative BTB/POZ domain-containing protein [Septoria linicola]|uniref:BTB/POZ domain-containing protein n=1 Tax=Septoria linicola TaxID=215465 RepID=A0A9Q9EPV9_9PEZI|nr:putative BTB/POZ domain-containing protein [Septoria linicola]USW59176.1 Putative BTB/POZ domain-containing protein [Septoria linicola]